MAFSGDEMSDALSAAVGAHLIQEGDLREEITNSMSDLIPDEDTRKPVGCSANNSALPARSHFIEAKQDSEYNMRRYAASPVDQLTYGDNPYSHSRPLHGPTNIPSNRHFAHPASDGQLHERFVFHDPQPPRYPPPHPGYFHKRQVEKYPITADTRHIPQYPDMPVQMRRSRSRSPPFAPVHPRLLEDRRRLEEFSAREPAAYKHQVLERPPFPMQHDRPLSPHHSAIHRSKSDFHLIPAEYSEFNRRPPSGASSRSRAKKRRNPKRFPRNTRSRVYSNTEGKEESFDDMLLDHKRHQKGSIENAGAVPDPSYSNVTNDVISIENHQKPLPKNLTQEFLPLQNQTRHHDPAINKPQESTLEVRRKTYFADEVKQPLPNHQVGMLRPVEDGFLEPLNTHAHDVSVQRRQNCNEELLLPIDQRKRSGDNLQLHEEGSIDEPDPCDKNRSGDEAQDVDHYSGTPPQSPFLQDSNQEEVDDDDDEELLTLRSAALLSAYHRNVDIDKNDNAQDKEAENKIKKKTKQPKEKKYSKKDTESSRRTVDVRSEPKDKVSKSELRTSPFIPLSPPIDPCDPSILTLGGVLKREKAKQEKALLHDIRRLNDSGVGAKIFMDFINTKNERDEKTKKKKEESHLPTSSINTSNSADNYDEVEMDVEDTQVDDVAVQASPSYDIDSLASDEEDSEPLCPPGTEEDHVSSSSVHTPTQENIWDLLEKPLANEPPTPQQLTAADMLIMSIRASSSNVPVAENVIKSLPEAIQDQTQPISSAPQNILDRENADNFQVDSPYDFQHAFEATDIPDPYPAIATDLNCVTRDDMTSAALDADISLLDSGLSAHSAPVNQESALPATAPSPGAVQSETERVREARHSIEDEDDEELRANLLKDLEQKRASVKPVHRQVQKTQSTIKIPPVKLGKIARQKYAKRFRMAKGNPKKIKVVQRKVKRALKYKRKRIRKKIRDQRKNEEHVAAMQAVIATTESNSYDPFLQFSQSLTSTAKANVAPIAMSPLQRVVTKKPVNPLKFKRQGGPPSASHNGIRATALPTRAQLTKVNTHPKRSPKSLTVTTTTAPVTSHPPVIIKYQLSSDEDDRRVVLRSSHPVKQDPQREIATTGNNVAAFTKATMAASPTAHNGAVSLQPTTDDISRKRKLFNEPSKEAKLPRPNGQPPQPSVASREVTHSTGVREVAMNTSNTDRRKVVFNTSPTTQVAADEELEANKKLSDFGWKSTKLRELLGRDKATVSRMRQQKAELQTKLQRLRKEAADLKKKLKENEIGMAKAAGDLEKHEAKASEVVSKMKKREKLQTKYLKEIEDLKAKQTKLKTVSVSQLSDKTTSIAVKRTVETVTPGSDSIVQAKTGAGSNPVVAESRSATKAKVVFQPSLEQAQKLQEQSLRKREREKSLLLEKSKALELEKEVLLRQTELLSKQASKRRVAVKPRRSALSSIATRKNGANHHVSSRRDTRLVVSAPNTRSRSLVASTANQDAKKAGKSSKAPPLHMTVVEPQLAASQSNSEVATRTEGRSAADEGQNELTPVTPTLKKKRGDRRSSSSSVVTPTDVADCSNSSQLLAEQDESELPNLTAKECNDLKKRLQDKLTSKAANRSLNDNSQNSLLVHLFPVPTCFHNWAVDVGEIAGRSSDKKEGLRGLSQGSQYKSPLIHFRSYRLSSLFQSCQDSSITSTTFSHKIHADQILCRYDLNGKCQDSKCRAQHFKDIKLTPSEIYLDLLWYCPTLLKTKGGKQVVPSDDIAVQLKAADDTVTRLCNTGRKADNAKRTVGETCAMLVNIINRALGNKDPHTTVLSRRRVRMQPTFDEDEEDKIPDASPDSVKSSLFQDALNMEDFGGNASEVRYYDEDNNHRTRIEKLSSLLQQHPEDELTRIQLSNAYLEHPKDDPSGHNKSIELALHTLCVGIEGNEQSERLWSAYVPVLRQHHNGETTNRDSELDIIDQILVLLPLSKPVWDEIFKWRWPFEKLDSFYEHLIENLITREAIMGSEDYNESISRKYSSAYYSSWLLQVMAERCHLLRQSGRRTEAKNFLSAAVKAISGTRKREEREFPLSQKDTVKLWLIYIHFIEFGKLPHTLYDDSLSSHKFGLVEAFSDVTIPFTSSRKLVQKPENLRSLFEDALQCLNNVSEDERVNAACKLQLYRSWVKLEASLENWDRVSVCCQNILEDLSSLTKTDDQALDVEVWAMWVDAVLQSNDPVLITQTFDSAITACPRSAKLSYMAAVYQLNSDNKDVEAAMLYLDCCIRSLIDLESDEGLSPLELHQCYRRLLKHDVSLQSSSHVQLRDGITTSHVEEEKTYLWLIYCLLMDLVQNNEQDTIYDQVKVTELYEAALQVVSSTEDRKAIWIQYLVYVRSTASDVDEETSSSDPRSKVAIRRDRLAWLKRFTSLVRRCLVAIPARYNEHSTEVERTYTDYTFHNEVCSIFFSCFKKSQLPVAMTILTDTLPTNLPLLSKAAFYFLRNEDYVSVSSLLWRVTSSYSGSNENCKNHKLWKAAATALVAEGKHMKAIRLYHRALANLPRCRTLWHDVAALTLAYGDSADLENINVECKKFLGENLRSLLQESVKLSEF